MKQFLITVAGVLVGLFLFLIIAPIVLIGMVASSTRSAPPTPPAIVLSLDLRQEMLDQRPSNPFASLGAPPSVIETIGRIEAAAEDDKVKGIYVRAATSGMAPAQAEEIRAALQAFRAAGKFVIAHVQNDGVRTSMPGYMAVADADEIWLQEASEFMPMGLSAEVTFFADTLQRYHMQAQFITREEYKTAPNTLTQRTLTPAHREELTSLMTGLYDQMIANIAADRGLSTAQVTAAVEATPYIGARARELGLIDQLGRPEDAERAALARAQDNRAQIVNFIDYHPAPRTGGPVIAVVQGEGAIVSGPDESDIFSSDPVMNSDVIARALLDASDADDVRAIVFRVSSPGGSVVASDQILAALRTAKERGKTVVVSMGDVAASGGYYVSAYADEIVASSATITGSIGVFGGKLIIGPAMDHYLSTNTETLSVDSPLVGSFTSERPFNQAERAAFEGFIDRAYQQFLGLVSDGRGLTLEQTRAVARGRVWTGAQAAENGLVDHVGGFNVAVQRARALAGVDEDARVQLRFYPQQESPFRELQRLFGVSAESAEALARLNVALNDPRVVRALEALREDDVNARAEAPVLEVR